MVLAVAGSGKDWIVTRNSLLSLISPPATLPGLLVYRGASDLYQSDISFCPADPHAVMS